MIIGSDFNKKCEKLLLEAESVSEQSTENKISVEELNEHLRFDRQEMRSYLEYLSDRNYLEILSIGGPLLYGHIRITRKGLEKAVSIRKKNGM